MATGLAQAGPADTVRRGKRQPNALLAMLRWASLAFGRRQATCLRLQGAIQAEAMEAKKIELLARRRDAGVHTLCEPRVESATADRAWGARFELEFEDLAWRPAAVGAAPRPCSASDPSNWPDQERATRSDNWTGRTSTPTVPCVQVEVGVTVLDHPPLSSHLGRLSWPTANMRGPWAQS